MLQKINFFEDFDTIYMSKAFIRRITRKNQSKNEWSRKPKKDFENQTTLPRSLWRNLVPSPLRTRNRLFTIHVYFDILFIVQFFVKLKRYLGYSDFFLNLLYPLNCEHTFCLEEQGEGTGHFKLSSAHSSQISG